MLHYVLQIALGWTDSHLHQFIVGDVYYGEPSVEDWEPVKNERCYHLNQIAPAVGAEFYYEYDFGDNWQHQIVVEHILPPNPELRYGVCVAGERGCPPEDVGGVPGYANFLEAMRDPDHPEHEEYRAWLSGDFDPEYWDMIAVNEDLRFLR